jgi:hypothetical protein
MIIPKIVMYTCTGCGLSKDETLMYGYPNKIAPRKPKCRLCVNKVHSREHARYSWKRKPLRMTQLAGRTKRALPNMLVSNNKSIQTPTLHRSYPTDTYLADGRFGSLIFRRKQ